MLLKQESHEILGNGRQKLPAIREISAAPGLDSRWFDIRTPECSCEQKMKMKNSCPHNRRQTKSQARSDRRWRERIVQAILAVGMGVPVALRSAPGDAASPANGGKVDLTEVSIEQLMDLKVQSVYAASKHEQVIAEAPANVTVIDSDEIKKYGYRSFPDILRSVPGMYVTDDRNYSYLGIRGFNRPGDYASRVLVLVNGHRVNENVFDGVVISQSSPIDVDLISRVEVIRGPGSSIYGNNAFFAVINVITKDGKDFNGGEASGTFASFGTYEGRFSYGQKLTNGVEFLASGSYYNSDGPSRLYYPQFNSPSNNVNNGVTRHTDYENAYSFFGSVSWKDFSFEGNYINREKGIPTGSYGTIFGDDRAKTVNQRGYANLRFAHTFENQLELTANVFYDYFAYDGDYPLDYSTYTSIYKDFAEGQLLGTDVQAIQKFYDRLTVTVGGEFHENLKQDQGSYEKNPSVVYFDDHRRTLDFAFYGQAEFQIQTNLILNAGLRYDYFETFGSTLNPRLALIYSPVPTTTLKALYGTAFKAPNAYELYYAGPSNKGNLDLDPEKITTYELVYEQRLGKHLQFVGSGFYYQIDNLINQTSDGGSPAKLVYENSDKATAYGAELGLEGKFTGGLRTRVSYSFQETKDDQTGDILSNSPRHLAKLNLILPIYKDKLFSGLELQYNSGVKSLLGNSIDDYWLLNATLYSHKIVKNLEVSAGVNNLLDQKIYHPGAGEHLQDQILQNGISGWLKLTYKF